MSFTPKQTMGLRAYFSHHFPNSVIDWDRTPAEDPLWNTCLSILIQRYKRMDSSTPARKYIQSRAVDALTGIFHQGVAKQFLRSHVVIDVSEAYARMQGCAERQQMNEFRHHTCLMPDNTDVIIDQRILLTDRVTNSQGDLTFEKIRGAVKQPLPIINTLDLLLNSDLANRDGILGDYNPNYGSVGQTKTALGTYGITHIFHYNVLLPRHKHEQQTIISHALHTYMKSKMEAISRYHLTMHNVRDLSIGVALLAGAYFLFKRR